MTKIKNISFIVSGLLILMVLLQLITILPHTIHSQPTELDSIYYHIPLAKKIIDGSIFQPTSYNNHLYFYPAASELILSLFIQLKIPLNLFNIFGWLVFALLLFYLSVKANIDKKQRIIFSLSLLLLPAMTRWLNTQVIDIWLTNFYIAALIMILCKKLDYTQWLLLGLALGMVAGSKASGLFFSLIFLIVYRKKLWQQISFSKIILFLIPFSLLGLSWYIRNLFLTSNPFYPLHFLFFKGEGININNDAIWKIIIFQPIVFFNFLVSEFILWPFLLIVIFFKRLKGIIKSLNLRINPLLQLAVFNGAILLLAPASVDNLAASARYFYPLLIPLYIWLFQQKDERIPTLYCAAILLNITSVLPFYPFHPKIFLLVGVFLLISYYLWFDTDTKRV